jgi:hypothetical protein
MRPLLRSGVIDGDEAATLIALRNRVQWVGLAQDLLGIILGILHRVIAKACSAGIVPVTARVRRDTPGHEIADVRHRDAALDQLHQVVVAKPGTQMAELGRLFDSRADAQANTFDTMLVPVHPRHRLAPNFAEAIEPIWPQIAVEIQFAVHTVHAYGVVRAGEHNAPHAMPPRPFANRVQAKQVVLDDLGQWPFDARASHVNQHFGAREQLVYEGGVAQIAVDPLPA